MIVPDVNLLVYAHNEDAPHHDPALRWWKDSLQGTRTVALPWAVVWGFVRIVTHARVLERPLTVSEAMDRVEAWLREPNVSILDPGPNHVTIMRRLFAATGVGGKLTTDTHLAAIAIEHQCELCSNDLDFARFPGLRWSNPLA